MGVSLTRSSSRVGPPFFLLYINDLPKIVTDTSKPILFVDDASVYNTNAELYELK